ncbi:helix-turn-helix domain-containing protein, partial [Desulfosporosinus sp. OT]|uniref:helix-turn-helix domain-containing protein n=1 Tax=Desulfosporosinus sp. OT TaxID=913865 RepID=UPI0002FC3AA6
MQTNESLESLILKAKSGERNALSQIIERFNPVLKKYCSSLEYEDAYNDLVIWMIRAVKQY